MNRMLTQMEKNKESKSKCPMMEETDGKAEQSLTPAPPIERGRILRVMPARHLGGKPTSCPTTIR